MCCAVIMVKLRYIVILILLIFFIVRPGLDDVGFIQIRTIYTQTVLPEWAGDVSDIDFIFMINE